MLLVASTLLVASCLDPSSCAKGRRWSNYTITSAPCTDCPHPAAGVPTDAACAQLCNSFPECTGWAWNTFQFCYLKGGELLEFVRTYPVDYTSIAAYRRHHSTRTTSTSTKSSSSSSSSSRYVRGEEIVLDIGVNRGQDSARYLRQGYSVIGVEPNPTALAMALDAQDNVRGQNARAEKAGKALFLNLAVGPPGAAASGSSAALPFYVNVHNDAWSSFDSRVACVEHPLQNNRFGWEHCKKIDVAMVGCDELILEHVHDITAGTASSESGRGGQPPPQVVHLAKIDAEGQERNCLLGFAALEWRLRPNFLDVEVHKCLPQQTVVLMYSLGYTGFKIVNQREAGFGYGGSADAGDSSIDIQTGNTTWRSAYDILVDGRCPGADSWCDLQAKKGASPPSERRWDADLERLLAALEDVWWHGIDHTRLGRHRGAHDLANWRCDAPPVTMTKG